MPARQLEWVCENLSTPLFILSVHLSVEKPEIKNILLPRHTGKLKRCTYIAGWPKLDSTYSQLEGMALGDQRRSRRSDSAALVVRYRTLEDAQRIAQLDECHKTGLRVIDCFQFELIPTSKYNIAALLLPVC